MITRTFSFLLIATLLTACTLFDPEANLKSERQLWEEAQGHMDGGRYLEATTALEELDGGFRLASMPTAHNWISSMPTSNRQNTRWRD